MMQKESEMPKENAERNDFYARSLWRLLQHFKKVLDSLDITEEGEFMHSLFILIYMFSL